MIVSIRSVPRVDMTSSWLRSMPGVPRAVRCSGPSTSPWLFCSIRTIDSSSPASIRSRSTPARARAIWASTTPNLTPRLCRAPGSRAPGIFSRRASSVQGGRQLDLARLADVAPDQVVEQVEDGGREHVHAEEAEVMPRAEAGDLQPQLGQGRVRLLDDLVDDVDVGPVGQPLAGEGAVLVDQVLAGRLHGRDRALLGRGEVEQLPAQRRGSLEI